jgi:hypothetical protein
MGNGWLTPRPGRFTHGKETRYHCTASWVGPRTGLDRYGKSRPPPRFFLCTLSVFLCPDCPGFYLLSLLYNTQHKHPCPQRDSKPQSQQASGRRPLGHWNRQGFDPRTVQAVASRYTDWAIPAHVIKAVCILSNFCVRKSFSSVGAIRSLPLTAPTLCVLHHNFCVAGW